jgi:hypothetical protein
MLLQKTTVSRASKQAQHQQPNLVKRFLTSIPELFDAIKRLWGVGAQDLL